MTVNLAKKYSSKVDERFKVGSLTAGAVNNDYEWTGVSAVKVYGINTVAMGDYTRTGTSRYGTPSELGDTVQEMLLAKDRAFTFTIDKGNEEEQMGAKEAGKALRRQIDEVAIPEKDTYIFGKIIAKNGASASTPVTASNAYQMFLAGQEALGNNKVPLAGRICYCSYAYYKFIKLDTSFVKASDMGMKIAVNGQVGTIDGVPLVPVPSAYLPTGVAFLITHKAACVAPQKLTEYNTHKNPPGINGTLVEGRLIYDAFVLDNKIGAIYTHYTTGTICAAPTLTYVGSSTDTITPASSTSGCNYKYTLDGTDPRDSATAIAVANGATINTSGWAAGTYYVRCYAKQSGNIDSVVTSQNIAVSDS